MRIFINLEVKLDSTQRQMKKVSLEILDSKAIKIIKDLEKQHLIKLTNDKCIKPNKSLRDFKGVLGNATIKDIDHKLQKLRDEWD